MPEIIFNGPSGRIEGRYHQSEQKQAPIALLLHPHPQFGGTMNNPIVHSLHYMFLDRGFSILRFNFRGVGRSQGLFENGAGELADAAAALDWMQGFNKEPRSCWIAGVSFGAWISMQLLMRRPEIDGFMSIAPLAKHYDFSFLAPCPASGLFVTAGADAVTPKENSDALVAKLQAQKGIEITHQELPGANHFFSDQVDDLTGVCGEYLDKRLAEDD
jgi:alpha/beta superfamily hydrolase